MDRAEPRGDRRGSRRAGCRELVAFTYNDPVIFAEYALDAADACHAAGSRRGGDRRLHPRRAARRVLRGMDAANVDLKAFTEDFYVKQCGAQPGAGARHAALPG
jgi:pyruvate formate lyase activating enzyme